MRNRMPLEYDKRPIRLREIEEVPKVDRRKKENKGKRLGPHEALWRVMLGRLYDWHWYSIVPTRAYSVKKLQQAHDAVRQRAYWNGCGKDVLTIIPTVAEGLCFRWKKDPAKTNTAEARAVRLQKRRKWQRPEKAPQPKAPDASIPSQDSAALPRRRRSRV